MNLAAFPTAAVPVATQRDDALRAVVTRIEVFDELAAAAPLWRRLERDAACMTPYQQYEWVAHWYEHIGRPDGVAPLIVVGVDSGGAPSVIFPFIWADRWGGRIARFCGGTHSNLNMPIWRPDAAPRMTGLHLREMLAHVATVRNIDLFALLGQPMHWCGAPNPFAALPHQASPDDVYNGILEPAATAFQPRLPSGMRKKERKLLKLPGYRRGVAQTPEQVVRVLDAFRQQKSQRFAQQGIPNIFDSPGVLAFIHAACLDGLIECRPVIELHALEGAGDVLAVVGGVRNHHRFSVMFNSITTGSYARMSPGIILLAGIVADCARRGITSFDLGAGHASYKDYFCTGSEQRFDCFIPFSARGRALGTAYRTLRGVKRALKNNPHLMAALQTVRRCNTAGPSAA